MINLSAKIRKDLGKKVKSLREKGILPAVLYGPKIKNFSLELDLKEFEKIYQEAGESSLVSLNVDFSGGPEKTEKKFIVLIHEVKLDPLTDKPIHVDFYQPKLDEEITATIPLVFEGEAPAVKDLGGTLVKNIQEVEVKALPQNLPHEIKVNVEGLKTFEDDILVKNLSVLKEVKILKEPEEVVASVAPPTKVEEELEKPIEEKVEEVGEAGEKKEEGAEEEVEEKAGEKAEGREEEKRVRPEKTGKSRN
jgi:large subunit ribosomal protein L25